MTTLALNKIENRSKVSLDHTNSAIENSLKSSLSSVELSLPSQPSPPSEFDVR
jgi:hypothetical protein